MKKIYNYAMIANILSINSILKPIDEVVSISLLINLSKPPKDLSSSIILKFR